MTSQENSEIHEQPADEREERQITLRVESTLKGRAVKASRARNIKLSPWLIEAIEEKATREGF